VLDSETKKHIDSARQVLVGKIPDPKTQVQEITNALIYKFMDDMDEQVASIGGKRRYFIGEYEKYSWRKIMDPKFGAHERYDLYTEALRKLALNRALPALFQGIFRNAYLPFNDSRTLSLFLQEINYFDYKHSEELGNAYEYLLSIMGSQGAAGQFRTPRHIIDFIVEAIDPDWNDSVLDPACGTGGFLVSAFKHVVKKHDGKDNKTGESVKTEKPLYADEKKKLYSNYLGFDIDDNMVKIAQVNMYLHGFQDPKIITHDTLSSEDYWRDKYDVILANPPFMSPKGGIVPHNKFSVNSTRAEVLFVDYIMNHLKPNGRAGIIVPEGIIFQSGAAHKQLRKNLVEDGLYAVVSLPSGVFNPYAGVKTSILLFNNELAKANTEILFVKIEEDGFDLGAQRRVISKNDLPFALEALTKWKAGEKLESSKVVYIEKETIAKDGGYNLSSDRYRGAIDYSNARWPMVELGEVAEVMKGSAITKKDTKVGNIPVIAGGQEPAYYHNDSNRTGGVITVSASGAYAGYVNYFTVPIFASDCSTIQTKRDSMVSTSYLFNVLKAKQEDIYEFQQGGGQPHVYPKDLKTIQIPLPPFEIQEQIVVEVDGYHKIISGAKQIVQNWKPKIDIDSEWGKVKLGEVIKAITPPLKIQKSEYLTEGKYPIIDQSQAEIAGWTNIENVLVKTKKPVVIFGDHTCAIKYSNIPFVQGADGIKILLTAENLLPEFLYYYLLAFPIQSDGYKRHYGKLTETEIPLPPLAIQKQIVVKIEAERTLVESAKKLIEIYEQKTKEVIAKLWED
jgi:type I restriction enzyme M protein